MKYVDYPKAIGVAIGIMILNVLISFVVVAVYSYFINPGHDNAFYQEAAQSIAPWSSVVFGIFLFFLAARLFAKSNPDRNALHFAIAFFVAYAVVDVLIVSLSGSLAELAIVLTISLVTKCIAAILGARTAP